MEHDPTNLPIHVTAEVTNLPKSLEYAYRVTTRTVVLSASLQSTQLLDGPDPGRCEVVIIAIDAPVVLSTDLSASQASDNTTVGIPTPRGALLPSGQVVRIPHAASELYVTCPLAGNAINRISVITTHRVRA